ncbi:MAG: hypothetical protein BWX55_01716 [Deltaproteobacteria bacterium ADurb.Bin022]|nr:MAG: hypothetical protein BWX55_01716 [Deltaproteobacteria bacterium ADurb.Bin022]
MTACFPFSAQTQTRTGFNTGGNFQLNGFDDPIFSRTPAVFAGGRYNLAMPVAVRTGGADGKKAAGLYHLASSPAGAADFRGGPGRRSCALTMMACGQFFQINCCGGSESGIQKRDGQIVTQIGAGSGVRMRPPPSIAVTENVIKDIAEMRKNIVEPAEAPESGAV